MNNVPNFLTVIRILFIPIIIYLFFIDGEYSRLLAALVFLFASVTDYFDGYFARLMKQQTNFGEFLDPIADKMLVITMLVLLVSENSDLLFVIPVLIIISREFLVIAIRQRLAEINSNHKLKVLLISKIKTGLQLTSLFFLLYKNNILGFNSYLFGVYLLQIASILTIISFIYYVRMSWSAIIK